MAIKKRLPKEELEGEELLSPGTHVHKRVPLVPSAEVDMEDVDEENIPPLQPLPRLRLSMFPNDTNYRSKYDCVVRIDNQSRGWCRGAY